MVKSIAEAIDQGIKRAGSGTRLAQVLECTRPNVADARAGRRGLTAYQVARLADYIGEDALELLALDALDRERDEARREVMRRLFFSGVVLGGLVCLCLLLSAPAAMARTLTDQVSSPVIRNIVAGIVAQIRKAHRMARGGFGAIRRPGSREDFRMPRTIAAAG